MTTTLSSHENTNSPGSLQKEPGASSCPNQEAVSIVKTPVSSKFISLIHDLVTQAVINELVDLNPDMLQDPVTLSLNELSTSLGSISVSNVGMVDQSKLDELTHNAIKFLFVVDKAIKREDGQPVEPILNEQFPNLAKLCCAVSGLVYVLSMESTVEDTHLGPILFGAQERDQIFSLNNYRIDITSLRSSAEQDFIFAEKLDDFLQSPNPVRFDRLTSAFESMGSVSDDKTESTSECPNPHKLLHTKAVIEAIKYASALDIEISTKAETVMSAVNRNLPMNIFRATAVSAVFLPIGVFPRAMILIGGSLATILLAATELHEPVCELIDKKSLRRITSKLFGDSYDPKSEHQKSLAFKFRVFSEQYLEK